LRLLVTSNNHRDSTLKYVHTKIWLAICRQIERTKCRRITKVHSKLLSQSYPVFLYCIVFMLALALELCLHFVQEERRTNANKIRHALPTLFACSLSCSRSCASKSTSSISSIRANLCGCFPLFPLLNFSPISYLNLFHLVLRISDGLTPLAERACAFGGGGGNAVNEALLADLIVFSSAASISIATELVARKETRREAKALCRLLTGVVFVLFCNVPFAGVEVLDLGTCDETCDLNVTLRCVEEAFRL
jgi:hypothetical protein